LSEGAESPDALPGGHGPDVDPEDWTRLTTKDKDRVRALRRQMSQMDSQNYFEWFSLSHEAPEASIKKAYFQLARLYHPDALVDEPKVYAAHAEALFARLSEAYDILDNEEERTKYIKKKILGEKDEQDLAREKVQKILAAENSFKAGQRFLNAGKLADALRHFRAAFEGYDQEAEYVAYYGFTLFRVKSASEPTAAQEGIELMKKATTMREMAPKPYHLLGKAYLQAGDWGEAKSWLRKSLKIQPDNPEALREYKRADDMQKGGATTLPSGKSGDEKGTGIAGLFGRFRKDKDAGKEKKAMTVEELLADGGEEEEE
jgi:tetratricopeptide (TPR) repeat protein